MTRTRTSRQRRGSTLYVAVMGVGLIVGAIALTTSVTGRLELRANRTRIDRLDATAAAHSGVEYALNWLNRTPTWRTELASGVDSELIVSRAGSFRFRVTDADGDLADDPRDHAVLRVESYQSDARYVVKVDIEPAGRALTCLEASICSASDIDLGPNSAIQGSGIVHAGNDISTSTGGIELDTEAVGSAQGGGYNAGLIEDAPPRETPGDHVFDWYLANGTEIAISDVPYSFGQYRMDLRLLSRELNPFGEANPHGIYWIDCQGNSIDLRWSRSLGTLVLINAGADMRFSDVAIYQPAASNYPALMVDGDLRIDLRSPITGQDLSEQLVFNYNPDGIPYEGVSDNDRTDSRQARLDGIVYASGTVEISDDSNFQGNLVADAITVDNNKTVDIQYTPYAFNYPPPGFSAGQGVRVLPGSYRQVSLDEP